MAGDAAKHLSHPIALGLLQLVAVEVGRHLVSLVDHHQVPLRGLQPFLQFLVAGQLIEACDQPRALLEGVAREGRLHHVAGEDVERELESIVQFLLPLLYQRSRRHDQHPVGVSSYVQFPDQESRHDRLARSRIVGQQEPKRLAGKHLLIHRLDLVGERVDVRPLDSQVGIEQMRQVDAERF